MSKKLKSKTQPVGEISPNRYRELLNNTKLLEISVISFNSFIIRDKFLLKNKLSIKISDNYSLTFSKNIVKAIASLELNVPIDNSNESIILIKVDYEVNIEIKGEIPSEFWNIYQSVTLPLQIWPYFREFVQNTTSRMNIPPLTLPILFK
jgi:preprotein translocase subunit SecB